MPHTSRRFFQAPSLLFLIFILLSATSVRGQSQSLQNVKPFLGDWKGELVLGEKKVSIVIHLVGTNDGEAISGTFDSPGQGAFGLQLNPVRVKGNQLSFEFQPAKISFSGELSAEGSISGKFTQRGESVPLVFSRSTSNESRKSRPQDPRPPLPYKAEEVFFENSAAPGVILAGTLTIPVEGEGPFPTVVLISGSGPQNRDSEVLGHRPFLILADQLTRNGLAVLRFDDRGVGKSKGDFAAATTLDFASDVIAAIKYLKTRTEVDSKHIGLIGHSEGGYVAPIVASRTRDVAFLVLLAGPGVSGAHLSLAQGASIARAEKTPDDEVQKNQALQKTLFGIYLSEPDPRKAEPRLIEEVKKFTAAISDEKKKDQDTQRLLASALGFNNGWFRFFLGYDPGPTLKKVRVPVLALNGSLDLQVDSAENLRAISRHLKSGGNRNVETMELPGLNHLFQSAKTGAPSEYGSIEETFSPTALRIITEWIQKTAHSTR